MFSHNYDRDSLDIYFQPSVMEEKEEKPVPGFMELLEGNYESGGSQETQMSSQGFSALLGDEDLFAGIKAEEIDEILVPQQQQHANVEPVSPVSTASIESMGMDIVDEGLKNAFEASSRKGTLTPLLKEELRCKIQKRRLDAGLEELQALQPHVPVAGPSHVSENGFKVFIKICYSHNIEQN